MDIETMKACRDELIAVRGFYRGITEEHEKKVKGGRIISHKWVFNEDYKKAILFGIDLINYFLNDENGYDRQILNFNYSLKENKILYQKLIKDCEEEFARCELLPTDCMFYKALLTVLQLIRKFG